MIRRYWLVVLDYLARRMGFALFSREALLSLGHLSYNFQRFTITSGSINDGTNRPDHVGPSARVRLKAMASDLRAIVMEGTYPNAH